MISYDYDLEFDVRHPKQGYSRKAARASAFRDFEEAPRRRERVKKPQILTPKRRDFKFEFDTDRN